MRERRLLRSLLLGSAMTAALTLAMPFEASAVAVDEERSASFYQDALKQLQDDNPAAAIIQLRNALQQNPDNIDARLLLGRLYLRAGDGPSAEKELRRALTARPSDETEILLGNALLMQQKYREVLSDISKDASTPELHREKLVLIGNAQFGLGALDKAEALYREVLEAEPKSLDATFALARLKAAQGDFDAANDLLQATFEINPEFFDAWLLKAELALRNRDYDEALKALDQADHIRPDDPRVHLARAQALLQSGKIDEGEKEVAAVLERQPNHPFAKYLQAGIDFARGQYEDADRIFLTIQDELRNFTPALLLGGLIKFSTGQYAQADNFLTRYVSRQPQNTAAQRVLGLVHLRQGTPQSAVEVLEPLVKAHPDDVAAQQLLASAYMRTGKYDEAAEIFERITQSDNPRVVQEARTALALLGQSLGIAQPDTGETPTEETSTGETPTGETPAENGELLATDNLSKGILLVLDYLRTRDFDPALDEVEKLKSEYPDNPIVLNIEGGVYLARGDEEQARQRFEEALKLDPNFMSALTNLDRLDLRAGHPEAVEKRMRDRLADDPKNEQMTLRLAKFLVEQKRPEEALTLLESARTPMPDSVGIRQALIATYLQGGKPDSAVPVAKEMAAIAADDPQALAFAARALYQAGAPADAAETYRKILTLQPESESVKVSLANALYAADRKDEARKILVDLRAQNPKNVAAAAGLIDFALSDGQPEKAMQIATELEENNPVAAAQLKSDVLTKTGRTEEAVALLSKAFQEHPVSELALNLFLARRAIGQQDKALADLKDWVGQHADDHQARLALASAFLEKGDYEAAAKNYEALLSANPNDAAVLNNLAWLKNELGQPGAVDYARRARRLAPDSPEITDTLGWLLIQSEETSTEGLNLLREAANAAPGNPDIQYHLAYALHETGDQDAAKTILEKLLTTDQPFTEREAAQLLLTELKG